VFFSTSKKPLTALPPFLESSPVSQPRERSKSISFCRMKKIAMIVTAQKITVE